MKNKFYQYEVFPSHITVKCRFSSWPKVSMDQLWRIFNRQLSELGSKNNLNCHAFVLMSNHFHLLSSIYGEQSSKLDIQLKDNIIELLDRVEQDFTELIGEECLIFSDDLWIHKVENIKAYQEIYKYIYRNPVDAGLADNVQSYPYSSLRYLLGFEKKEFPCIDNMNLISNPYRVLNWLNQSKQIWMVH